MGRAWARRIVFWVRDLCGRIRIMAPTPSTWRTLDPRWTALRDEHLGAWPRCAARSGSCRGRREVHHVRPRHLYPEDTYDAANLITLCAYHHLALGHGGDDWWGWVPEVRRIAERSRVLGVTLYDDILTAQRQRIYRRLDTPVELTA